ncbi:hypothetical protein MLD38_003122 [Melastoma candidum]|uniref:Uncharacterized protein n=1 Tax=Melastoma candidum TaxID=119954 RepID=A0ACB9S269_9MYRT|nr:hypothetical protein MLD38_003122 [Melastoma candidum]
MYGGVCPLRVCVGSAKTVRGSIRFSSQASFVEEDGPSEFAALCADGRLRKAFSSFRHLLWSEPRHFSYFVGSCLLKSCLPLGRQVHSLVITSGSSWDRFVCNHLLNMYFKLGESECALKVFDRMPTRNFMSCNILINGYTSTGDLDHARKVFDKMDDRNVPSWNAMITGYTQYEYNEEALALFAEMHALGFSPDEFTFGSVLRGCAGLKDLCFGCQGHAHVIKGGFELNLVVGSSLAHMYMKSGCLRDGEKVIRTMPIRNVVAWNTLIAGKAQNGCPEVVLDQYNLMKVAGFRPDRITFVSAISACSDLATLGQGQQVHAEAIKLGATSVTGVVSSLVSMYSRCGCLEESRRAFGEKIDADVVLWSSMIAAYGFHGRGDEAIQLYERMEKENVEVNDVTFLSLLYACSHSGLKDDGKRLFDVMVEKHGLQPQLQHYTCMVDLLGRSGCLDEAEETVRTMPVKADVVIWKTLLSACKIHKNADMARRVAEEVLRIDPQDSASYVLLSNANASVERWLEVSKVRKSMKDRQVKKEPGVSWVEIKNQIYEFSMAAKSHPFSDEIDEYLKELTDEMKLVGYVPNMSAILHDMEQEEKEYNLAHHSEKLAIAYALMNTPPGTPIRVMKNLRVCDDCHIAIKYITRIRNREIIVRDATRFHHFKDGQCSCRDYW